MNYKEFPFVRRIVYEHRLFKQYKNEHKNESQGKYIIRNLPKTKIVSGNKKKQLLELIDSVNIEPIESEIFFYSIDCYKNVTHTNQILDNYSIDYSWVVNESFEYLLRCCKSNTMRNEMSDVVEAWRGYLKKAKNKYANYKRQFVEIEGLFNRPTKHFEEALQRILFVNQWLWQSGHKHNGFGHLDWILIELYRADIYSGVLSEESAKKLIMEFFKVLHYNCWYKSTNLLGDTGQIIILGGLDQKDRYNCNELTYLFIAASKKIHLPDPKVLLRVSKSMPDDLLKKAVECIATGIGAPLLSNDDVVIPALINFGYSSTDAYNYATAACWEPLIVGNSADQNNVNTFNFAEPFTELINRESFNQEKSIEEIKNDYLKCLQDYTKKFLKKYENKVFEEDLLLTIFSPYCLRVGKNITGGGAKYNNIGFTSVGLSTVVNSILNIDDRVFKNAEMTLKKFNDIRLSNYKDNFELKKRLRSAEVLFGNDNKEVLALVEEILNVTSTEFKKHRTKLGGYFKYGLSSPNYITDGSKTCATFDGRMDNDPFNVHISDNRGTALTELLSFASEIEYKENRINGNVVDVILPPVMLEESIDKVCSALRTGILIGIYQIQINVIDSKMLIDAQKNPDQYSNLSVRVWGFSAYFNDLPKEYQDNLIKRTLESEGKY